MSLNLQKIRGELQRQKGLWPRICDKTGLDYSWLTKFAQGQIKSPGFEKVQILAAHLFPADAPVRLAKGRRRTA